MILFGLILVGKDDQFILNLKVGFIQKLNSLIDELVIYSIRKLTSNPLSI
jgi:hypothetical protein